MTSRKRSERRERRDFSAEFKAEAVRMVAERRAMGDALEAIGADCAARGARVRRSLTTHDRGKK